MTDAPPLNRNHPLALAVFLALLLGAVPVLAGDAAAGRKTYINICSPCHGLDGRAGLDYVPSFFYGERLRGSDSRLLRSVRDGAGRMPPWGGYLSDKVILDAIAFARTLRKERGGRH